jgi:hypothetical protein
LDDERDDEKIEVARDVAAIALTSVHGLYILDLQSSQEGSILPPAVPLSLLDMSPPSLQDSLVAMRSRLSLTLPTDVPHKVCSEHTGLKRDVSNSDDLKIKQEEAANRAGAADYFRTYWEPLSGNYPHLQHFAGGLSTVFPGCSTVESDFSILKFEKIDHRISLSDVCIEGIFHARQLEEVEQLQVESKNGNFVFEPELRNRTAGGEAHSGMVVFEGVQGYTRKDTDR